MKIFATFDNDGLPTGFYPEDIHSQNIPADAVVISEAQWHDFISNQGARRWSHGRVVDYVPPRTLATHTDVDRERDRRIDGGFEFQGVRYQSRPQDRENIAGAAVAALAAISSGAVVGDYRWHGADSDFQWIAEDNTLHLMDAHTMFAFGQAAMAHKQSMIFAARALKDMAEIPVDYADDQYWLA